jgi:hypothetical protein
LGSFPRFRLWKDPRRPVFMHSLLGFVSSISPLERSSPASLHALITWVRFLDFASEDPRDRDFMHSLFVLVFRSRAMAGEHVGFRQSSPRSLPPQSRGSPPWGATGSSGPPSPSEASADQSEGPGRPAARMPPTTASGPAQATTNFPEADLSPRRPTPNRSPSSISMPQVLRFRNEAQGGRRLYRKLHISRKSLSRQEQSALGPVANLDRIRACINLWPRV